MKLRKVITFCSLLSVFVLPLKSFSATTGDTDIKDLSTATNNNKKVVLVKTGHPQTGGSDIFTYFVSEGDPVNDYWFSMLINAHITSSRSDIVVEYDPDETKTILVGTPAQKYYKLTDVRYHTDYP